MKCNYCLADNPDGYRFCSKCGRPLEVPAQNQSSLQKQNLHPKARECPACHHMNQSTDRFCEACGSNLDSPVSEPQKKSRNRVLLWTAGLAAAAVIGISGGLWLVRSQDSGNVSDLKEEDKIADISESSPEKEAGSEKDQKADADEKAKPDEKSASDQPDEKESTEDESTRVSQIEEHPADSGIYLDVAVVAKNQDNYSGPACSQMLLETRGIPVSQQDVAAASGLTSGQVADYLQMTEFINRRLSDHADLHLYSGVYLDDSEWNEAARDLFEKKIRENLADGYPVIVVVGPSDFSGLSKNSYALISGIKGDEIELIVPGTQSSEPVILDFGRLISDMHDAGIYCYIV